MLEVYLNVYDLPEQSTRNDSLFALGLGFYHSGIEFNNYEYSFSTSGVARTRPCLAEFGVLRDHILLGSYNGTASDFQLILSTLKADLFQPGSYDLLSRNCNHFSNALSQALIMLRFRTG